jgi:hypothetical protein
MPTKESLDAVMQRLNVEQRQRTARRIGELFLEAEQESRMDSRARNDNIESRMDSRAKQGEERQHKQGHGRYRHRQESVEGGQRSDAGSDMEVECGHHSSHSTPSLFLELPYMTS